MDNPFLPEVADIVDKILYQIRNNLITNTETLELLADISVVIKDVWILDIFNSCHEVARRVDYSQYNVYPQERPARSDMNTRIREAARRYCHDESVRYWRSDTTAHAFMAGLCEDYEVYSFERKAREQQTWEKTSIG